MEQKMVLPSFGSTVFSQKEEKRERNVNIGGIRLTWEGD